MSPNNDPINPDAKVELISRWGATHYRNYHSFESDVNHEDFDANSYSQWLELVGGQQYYIESQLKQGGGGVHLTVGFEVAPTNPIVDHPMQKK
jgi:hypothetical protein